MDEVIVFMALINVLLIALLLYGWLRSKKHYCSPCICPSPEPCLVLFTSGILSPEQISVVATDPPVVVPAVRDKIIQYVAGNIRFVPGTVKYVEPAITNAFFSYNPLGRPNGEGTFVAQNDQPFFWGQPFFASTTIVTLHMRQYQNFVGNTTSLPLYFSIASDNLNPTGGTGTLEYYIYYALIDPL